MNKQLFIIIALILGISIKSYAGTGGAKDGFMFFASIIGFLSLIWVLLAGGSYLKKNGRKIISKAIHAIKGFLNPVIDNIRKTKILWKHNPYRIKSRRWVS